MPPKKKVTITPTPPIPTTSSVKTTEDDDDKSSVSTDSDIMSGTFSQLDENEEQPEEEVNESDVESEEEAEEVEDIIEATEEEPVEEEASDVPKIKKKKGIKKTVVTNSDCIYNNIDFEEDYDEKEEQVEDSKRICINRLTKYEKVRIIGIRAKQIMTGANILIKGVENKTPVEIAELELKYNMVPFKIKRRLPTGKFEIWKLSELEK